MYKRFINRKALEKKCGFDDFMGVKPDICQGLNLIRPLISQAWNNYTGPLVPGRGDSLIVLGVDAISYDIANRVWSPDLLIPLTSSFPSTSVVAWLSAMTGLDVSEHEVPGVVYYLKEANGLFHCFRDIGLTYGKNWSKSHPASSVCLGPWTTIFHDIKKGACVAHAGDLLNWPGRWSQALLSGATVIQPQIDFSTIRFDPSKLVNWAVTGIEKTICKRQPNFPLFSWTMLNFDDYVHFNGYSTELTDALCYLEKAILRWIRQGHTVVAHSDHGMVPNYISTKVLDEWELISSLEFCRLPAGGAGRVRWLYPLRKRETEIYDRLRKLLNNHALVLWREELTNYGLLTVTENIKERIGEIVVIALDSFFPVPDLNYIYEHGSITSDEMIVPLAVWQGHN